MSTDTRLQRKLQRTSPQDPTPGEGGDQANRRPGGAPRLSSAPGDLGPKATSADPYAYAEEALSSALGLPLELLRKNRLAHLEQVIHWNLRRGAVAYSHPGLIAALDRLWPHLQNGPRPMPTITELLEKCRLPGAQDIQNALVQRTYANPRIVDVVLPDARTVRISVQTSKNLRPGMVLRVRGVGNGAHHPVPEEYELAQRLPRTLREGRRAAT